MITTRWAICLVSLCSCAANYKTVAVESAPPRLVAAPAAGSRIQLLSLNDAEVRGELASPSGSPIEEKIIVEATGRLLVDVLGEAVPRVRALVRELGGKLARDEIYSDSGRAMFVLRLPPAQVDPFFDRLGELGELADRNVVATDVTRQFNDTTIQLDNLHKALARYQEILAAATKVEEMLAVEAQLTRVKGEIERLKGELQFLSDRVNLSTITLHVYPKDAGATFAPRAKLHPGLRYGFAGTFARGKEAALWYGPGLSLHFFRHFHAEVDLLSDIEREPWRADAIVATVGGETYSDFLGRGKRTWLNPYVGAQLGYARLGERDFFAMGLAFGLELYKSTYLLVDLNLRGQVLFGEGPSQLALQPTLGANIAF